MYSVQVYSVQVNSVQCTVYKSTVYMCTSEQWFSLQCTVINCTVYPDQVYKSTVYSGQSKVYKWKVFSASAPFFSASAVNMPYFKSIPINCFQHFHIDEFESFLCNSSIHLTAGIFIEILATELWHSLFIHIVINWIALWCWDNEMENWIKSRKVLIRDCHSRCGIGAFHSFSL